MLKVLALPALFALTFAFPDGDEPSKTEAAVGDPYTLTTCAVSGKELGSMGDPVVLEVEGREARLCCSGCVKGLKAEPAKVFERLDAAFVQDQKPHYPLETCVVSDKPLVRDDKDVGRDVVVLNRLFRTCSEECSKKLEAGPKPFFEKLDAAVKRTQDASYPLKTCAVREKGELGSMGEPTVLVVANRLVKFCCKGCEPRFLKNPTEYLPRLDEAWARARKEAEAETK